MPIDQVIIRVPQPKTSKVALTPLEMEKVCQSESTRLALAAAFLNALNQQRGNGKKLDYKNLIAQFFKGKVEILSVGAETSYINRNIEIYVHTTKTPMRNKKTK